MIIYYGWTILNNVFINIGKYYLLALNTRPMILVFNVKIKKNSSIVVIEV